MLAPGLRIAWLTAHEKVIEKVLYHFHGVAMGACSLSQVNTCSREQNPMTSHSRSGPTCVADSQDHTTQKPLFGLSMASEFQTYGIRNFRRCLNGRKILNCLAHAMQVVVGSLLQRMGQEGFEAHVKDIQGQYAERASVIQAAAAKHLTGLADWAPVTAGMFMWVRLRGFEDASQILGELQDAKVIVVPGKPLHLLLWTPLCRLLINMSGLIACTMNSMSKLTYANKQGSKV